MTEDFDQIDEITAQLRAQDARLRRRIIWLSLLPVVVGIAVLAAAWWGVEAARNQRAVLQQQNDSLQAQFGELEQQRGMLDQRIAAQQAAIVELETERTALDRDIVSRKELLAQFAPKLPAAQRAELKKLEQGIDQVKSGNLDGAIRSYETAISSNSASPLPYRLAGYAYYRDQRFELAIKNLRQALAIDPKDAESRYMLGIALWAQGNQQTQAVAEIKRAFEQDSAVKARGLQDPAYRPIRDHIDASAGKASGGSEEEKAWIEKGLSAAKKGEFDLAIENYAGALKLNPDNWKVLHWQAYALYRNKQYEQAIKTSEQALKIRPREAEIHYNLALALWKIDRQQEARKAIQRAYEVDPAFREVAEQDHQSKALRASMPR